MQIVLRGHLAHKTLLLLGCDLADSYFQRLYRKVIASLDNPNQHVYALVEQALPAGVLGWCKRRRIEVIEAEAVSFLTHWLIIWSPKLPQPPRLIGQLSRTPS